MSSGQMAGAPSRLQQGTGFDNAPAGPLRVEGALGRTTVLTGRPDGRTVLQSRAALN